MNRAQLLKRIDRAWTEFADSYAGLSESQMTDVPVTRTWSVKDLISHVTWWEEEALKYLPLIAEGERPPKYSAMYGGLDAFNALMTEERRKLSLAQVLARAAETHERLLAYVTQAPEGLFATDTRWRRRLRVDTYSHYPIHGRAIREWRERGR